jgi:hypothetical protein
MASYVGRSLLRKKNMFEEIKAELFRVKACGVELNSAERVGSLRHSLVKVTLGHRSCTIAVRGFLVMLKSLPDNATEASVQAALEMRSSNAEAWAVANAN